MTRRYTASGELIREYPMISNYWFPSLPVFPQAPENSGIENIAADAPETLGIVFDLQGRRVKSDINYGEWTDLAPGMYIWKTPTSSEKFYIAR